MASKQPADRWMVQVPLLWMGSYTLLLVTVVSSAGREMSCSPSASSSNCVKREKEHKKHKRHKERGNLSCASCASCVPSFFAGCCEETYLPTASTNSLHCPQQSKNLSG